MTVETKTLPPELVDRIRAVGEAVPAGCHELVSVSVATHDPAVLPRLHEEFGGELHEGEWIVWNAYDRRFTFQVSYIGGDDDDA